MWFRVWSICTPQAEWHSRSTLRFYQSNDLVSLLAPNVSDAAPLLELPPLSVGAPNLGALRVPPLDRLLRLPATLEHVDVPLQPHDQWSASTPEGLELRV